jgi:hypothetical protein
MTDWVANPDASARRTSKFTVEGGGATVPTIAISGTNYTHTTNWDATNRKYTVTISHNGGVNLTINASGGTSNPNLVVNPGFETGNLGAWTASGGGSTVVSNNAQNGVYALRINGASSGGNQIITCLTPNTTYVLTGWIKNLNAGDVTFMGVKNFGNPEISKGTTSTAYTQLSITFTTGSGTAGTQAQIYVWKNASTGYSFADQFRLIRQ